MPIQGEGPGSLDPSLVSFLAISLAIETEMSFAGGLYIKPM